MTSETAKSRIREEHRLLSSQNIARFRLPQEGIGRNFRVRTRATHLKRCGKNWQLKFNDKTMEISADNAALVEWMLDGQLFTRTEIRGAFPDHGQNNCDTLLTLLQEFAVISEF